MKNTIFVMNDLWGQNDIVRLCFEKCGLFLEFCLKCRAFLEKYYENEARAGKI